MKQVGITGGIGSGKSLVCRIFSCLGVPVYDADSRARHLMDQQPDVRAAIVEVFGTASYQEGTLNRVWLAAQTFGKPDALQKLNSIVHPAVAVDYNNWVQQQRAPYVMKEAALLFEAGSYQGLDEVIVVTAPESLRLSRVLERDPRRTEADVHRIFASQWPEEKKVALAQHVIINDNLHPVLAPVLLLHKQFSS